MNPFAENTFTRDIIFITASTGAGKSYFILNVYLDWIIQRGGKLLYLVNRRILREQDMDNDGVTEEHSKYSFYVSDAAEKFRRFANTVMPFDVPTTNVVNIEEY